MSSQMSSHVDEQSPHEEFMTKFADRAGHRTVETRFKPMRKPGLRHTESMFDIMGRTGVARTPRGISVREVTAAGGKTEPELQRQEGRACVIATKWTRSTLRIGESEHPGALLEDLPDERFDGHAGKARKPESVATTAKHGASLKSISAVDKLLYGRDLSKATTDPGLEYAERFAGYAGCVWKMPKKKAPSPQNEREVKECEVDSSVADPILPGHPQDAQDGNFSPLSPTSISLADPPEAQGEFTQPLTPQIGAQSPPQTPTPTPCRASPFNVKRQSFSSSSSRASSVSGVSSRHAGRPRWQWEEVKVGCLSFFGRFWRVFLFSFFQLKRIWFLLDFSKVEEVLNDEWDFKIAWKFLVLFFCGLAGGHCYSTAAMWKMYKSRDV